MTTDGPLLQNASFMLTDTKVESGELYQVVGKKGLLK